MRKVISILILSLFANYAMAMPDRVQKNIRAKASKAKKARIEKIKKALKAKQDLEDLVPKALTYGKIKIKDISFINGAKNEVDSVSVNNDGTKVCWVGKGHNIEKIPRNTIYHMDLVNSPNSLWVVPKKTPLDAHVRCTYDLNDDLILSELTYKIGALIKTFLYMKRTGEYEPFGFNSNFSTYNKLGYRTKRIRPRHLGHPYNTLYIKHPKVSPDGKWIVYYTHEDHNEMGIYLLHRESGVVHKITDLYDKHPVWSPDGTKIIFHHQRDVNGLEQAYLGYYDLKKLSVDEVIAERVMLDDENMPGYIYHKHPGMYPKENILYFHGKKKPHGKKSIFARRLKPNSKVYEIKMKYNGTKMKNVKHPHTSKVDDGIFVVGKSSEDHKYKIYKMNVSGSDKIIRKMEEDENNQ